MANTVAYDKASVNARQQPERPPARERWYGQPVVWLAAATLLAVITGCIGLIVSASRHPDEPLQVSSDRLLRVPVTREPQRSP